MLRFVLIESVRRRLAQVMLVVCGLIIASFATGIIKPLLGVEFTGGVVYTIDAPIKDARAALGENPLLMVSSSQDVSTVQMAQVSDMTEAQKAFVDKHLLAQDTIGASLGEELVSVSLKGLGLAFLGVMAYLTFRYNATMAAATLLALVHDVVFTVFALWLFNVPFTSIVVGAVLAIIGYSINDSVVSLDRVRELVRAGHNAPIQKALEMTLQRNVYTAVSTLIVVVSLLVFGGEAMYAFAFTMLVGVGVGMFSSLTLVPYFVSLRDKASALAITKKPSLDGEL